MRRRIILINNGYPTIKSPNRSTYIKSITECLVALGLDVELNVLIDDFANTKQKIVRYLVFYKDLLIKKFCVEDLLFIHHVPFVIIPLFFKKISCRDVIINWHGEDLVSNSIFIKALRVFSILKFTNARHVVPSIYFKEKLMAQFEIDSKNIYVIPSGGVDTEMFKPASCNLEVNNVFIIGFASGLEIGKGATILAQLIDYATNLGLPIKFHIILYGSLQKHFRRRYSENKNVVFIEKMKKNNMPNFFLNINMLFFPTLREAESLGLVAIEAMSCNIPVLGPKRFELIRIINPGINGEFYESESVYDIIKEVHKIKRDLVNYSPRSSIVERYSKSTVVELYAKLFKIDFIQRVIAQLASVCFLENFRGWDPYDGLNSEVFQKSSLRRSRFFRLLWIQLFKISPINFRRLLLVPKQYNAKGLGLFLTGYCNKYIQGKNSSDLEAINFLVSKILDLKSQGYAGSCWGYNFDWQARAFFQPKGTPTIVATSFVANALLDAYEVLKDEKLLNEARSSCNFILKDLNRTNNERGDFCFSYSPLDKTQVFNASVLGSRLLARVYSYTQEEELKDSAKRSINFCLPFQRADGAWPYGTLPYHQWVDNFHTGYMIECISEYQKYTADHQYDAVISKSLDYYLTTFFEESGIPKYYDNKRYPIDIHAPAQLLVTLYRVGKLHENRDLVERVLKWVHENMWDKKGFYYFQKRKLWTSKIPYMRWAQAWMFYSLSYYNREFDQ